MGDNDRIGPDRGSRASMAMVIAGLIVIGVAIFVAQNTEEIEFEFLMFNFQMPLWFVLVAVFVLGAVAGQGLMWLRRRRARDD